MDTTKFVNQFDAVFAAIDGEREYQKLRWNEHPHSISDFVVFMRYYHNQVVMRASKEVGWDGALDELRKVATLAVACIEQHGLEDRRPVEALSSPADRKDVYQAISDMININPRPFAYGVGDKEECAKSLSAAILAVGHAITGAENSIIMLNDDRINGIGMPREWALVIAVRCVWAMVNHGTVERENHISKDNI